MEDICFFGKKKDTMLGTIFISTLVELYMVIFHHEIATSVFAIGPVNDGHYDGNNEVFGTSGQKVTVLNLFPRRDSNLLTLHHGQFSVIFF